MALVIGLSGPTASGKSTLAAKLAESLDAFRPILIHQDRYFRDWHEYEGAARAAERTSNHPRGVLWTELEDHVRILRSGGSIEIPVPGTRSAQRGDPVSTVGPSKVVLVEGHLIYNRYPLMDLMDLRLFAEAFVHERVVRRLKRDTDGGTAFEGAIAWYRRDVIPNIVHYSEQTVRHADLVVPCDTDNRKAVDMITQWVNARA